MENGKKTILVVEDEQALNMALSMKLEKEGFSVLKAFDGEEGLKIALEKHPNLILLDMIMPRMDGITTLGKLREDEDWGRRVPVIMLTNLSDAEGVDAALKGGVHSYLVKSDWKLEDVVEKVKEELK